MFQVHEEKVTTTTLFVKTDVPAERMYAVLMRSANSSNGRKLVALIESENSAIRYARERNNGTGTMRYSVHAVSVTNPGIEFVGKEAIYGD